MIFHEEPLFQIFSVLRDRIETVKVNETIEFEVIDPDVSNEFSGTLISVAGEKYVYRPFKVWVDLAEILHCKMLTPKTLTGSRILIRYKILDMSRSWHNHSGIDITERYGCGSEFSKIFKFEEPYFLNDFLRSLNMAGVKEGMKILDLGINRGDEFKIFNEFFRHASEKIIFTGIDHCASAIKQAKSDLKSDNYIFYDNDLSDIASLNLPKQDIIISIGTLQSPEFDGSAVFRYLVQNLLNEEGSIILGFPNSRYIDCEVVYGAKTKNYAESNLNLLIKDISSHKRYLQQHKFKTVTFGKYYIFLVAKK
jgi:hypothetical protein